MRWLRRLLGTDFPDPQLGQVWRSMNSGRAIRVTEVQRTDCGKMWHVSLQIEDSRGFIPISMSYYFYHSQWRRMLREERRVLEAELP